MTAIQKTVLIGLLALLALSGCDAAGARQQAIPTEGPTHPSPDMTNVKHTPRGHPHLGGSVLDFYGAYGVQTPFQDGGTDNYVATWEWDPYSGKMTDAGGYLFLLSVSFKGATQVVSDVSYGGDAHWTQKQYLNYIMQFFPPGAVLERCTKALSHTEC